MHVIEGGEFTDEFSILYIGLHEVAVENPGSLPNRSVEMTPQ